MGKTLVTNRELVFVPFCFLSVRTKYEDTVKYFPKGPLLEWPARDLIRYISTTCGFRSYSPCTLSNVSQHRRSIGRFSDIYGARMVSSVWFGQSCEQAGSQAGRYFLAPPHHPPLAHLRDVIIRSRKLAPQTACRCSRLRYKEQAAARTNTYTYFT
jgi:hypothetical protein